MCLAWRPGAIVAAPKDQGAEKAVRRRARKLLLTVARVARVDALFHVTGATGSYRSACAARFVRASQPLLRLAADRWHRDPDPDLRPSRRRDGRDGSGRGS